MLGQPLELPCGLVLPNRILKAAMAESLATVRQDPSADLLRLYRRWARGGAGALITGNIGVRPGALDGVPVVLGPGSDVPALAAWAEVVREQDVRIFGQINHAGRQATRLFAAKPVAPSAVGAVRGMRALFAPARALSVREIGSLIEDFARAAEILQRAGFDGVEVHAAHGYLIGQFLSPLTNRRTDAWGGSLRNRARFLLEIVRAIRARVRPGFAVLVKINSSDFRPGGFDVDDSAHVVAMLGGEGVDLIEVSGGTYESRSSAMGVSARDEGTSPDAYFAALASRLREMTDVPLALTGGLRSRAVMEQLLAEGVVDAVGLGRPFVQYPDVAARLLHGEIERIELSKPGAGELFWYMAQFRRLARGEDFAADLSAVAVAELAGRTTLSRARTTVLSTLSVLPGALIPGRATRV